MSDQWIKEAERIGDENCAYADWVESNREHILECYINTDPEAPEDLYEQVLDDEQPDVYDKWISSLDFKDVPDEIINTIHNNWLQGD